MNRRKSKGSVKLQLDNNMIRLKNVRDRWLLNSRAQDYDVFVKAVFLLIQTKKDMKFAENTKMMDNVQKDFSNMESYIE